MRYLTHQFAHLETLERARRWLVHAGFDSSQIEVDDRRDSPDRRAGGPGQGAEAEFDHRCRRADRSRRACPASGISPQQELIHTNAHALQRTRGCRGDLRVAHLRRRLPACPTSGRSWESSVTAIAMRDAYIDRQGF